MKSWIHHNTMVVLEKNRKILTGDTRGFLHTLDLDSLMLLNSQKVSQGSIQSLSLIEDTLAIYSQDFCVTLADVSRDMPKILDTIDLTQIEGDKFQTAASETQAISLHPNCNELAVRAPNGGLAIFKREQGQYVLSQFLRLFEIHDIMASKYIKGGEYLLVGSNRGEVAIVKNGELIHTIKLAGINETLHEFCELVDGEVAIATDARKMIILAADLTSYRVGETITADDIEFVGQLSNRNLFITSFDRNIYEIDWQSLSVVRVIFKAPFKLRWCYQLQSSNHLVVHSRDGSIFKVDVATGEAAVHKLTPDCIWTSAQLGGLIFFSGEGSQIFSYIQGGRVKSHCHLEFSNRNAFTKRMVSGQDQLYLGRSDGLLIEVKKDGEQKRLRNYKSAIRDLGYDKNRHRLIVCCESGFFEVIDLATGKSLYEEKRTQPIWSLAVSPNGERLAIGERVGKLVIYDALNFTPLIDTDTVLPKRMKWLTDDSLFVSCSGSVDKIAYHQGEWACYKRKYFDLENTIEDFDFDLVNNLLYVVNYNKKLTAFNLATGEKLSFVLDGTEVIKGLRLDRTEMGIQVTTYGRSGRLNFYLAHNKNLIRTSTLEIEG